MPSAWHCLSSSRGDRITNKEMRNYLENLPCCKDCIEPGGKKKMPYTSTKGGRCPASGLQGSLSSIMCPSSPDLSGTFCWTCQSPSLYGRPKKYFRSGLPGSEQRGADISLNL